MLNGYEERMHQRVLTDFKSKHRSACYHNLLNFDLFWNSKQKFKLSSFHFFSEQIKNRRGPTVTAQAQLRFPRKIPLPNLVQCLFTLGEKRTVPALFFQMDDRGTISATVLPIIKIPQL